MPYQMLKYLATITGPTVLTEPDDIERVVVLRSAELVEADVPPTIDGPLRQTSCRFSDLHRSTTP